MRPSLLLVAVLLSACGVSQSSWPQSSAASACRYTQACAALAFNTEWDDLQACVTATAADMQTRMNAYPATCQYHKDVAAKCISAQAKAASTCTPEGTADVATVCAGVVTCEGDDGGGGLNTDSFLTQYSEATCAFARDCGGGTQMQYKACVDAAKDAWQIYEDQGCTVDAADAGACLSGLENALGDCNFNKLANLSESCVDAFVCDGGGGGPIDTF